MRNKKLTPQQKLLKRKKMIERQEKKIINELKLEEQQILEQQKHQNYIDGIKNKMEEIGDIGNLYHITCIDRGNKILNTGLKGGKEKTMMVVRETIHMEIYTSLMIKTQERGMGL